MQPLEMSEEENSKEQNESKKSDSMWIISMIISYTFTSIAASSINPFFPIFMLERDSSNLMAGFIICTVWIPQLIFYPILCNVAIDFGVKTVFVMGNFIFMVTTILFAFTGSIETYVIFIVLCFLIKFIQGVGLAFIKTAAVCLASRHMPSKSYDILGILETGSALGFSIGPILGGILYDFLDYRMAVLIPGLILILVFIFAIFSMNRRTEFPETNVGNSDEQKESEVGVSYQLSQLRKISNTYILGFCAFLSFCIPSYYDIMFPMYGTEQVGLKPSVIGIILLLFAVPDCIATVISSQIIERVGDGPKILFAGTFVCAICFLAISLLGYFQILNYYLFVTLIIIQGAVTSLMLVPVFKLLKKTAFNHGMIIDEELNVAISNIVVVSAMTGQVFGNGFSGLLYDFLGVYYTSMMFFVLICILMVFQLKLIIRQDEPNELTSLLE